MSRLNTAILTAVAILTATSVFIQLDPQQNGKLPKEIVTAFTKWSSSEGRLYGSPKELSYRMTVFASNYNIITEHNKRQSSWKMGLNKFADLTEEEYKARYLQEPASQASLSSQGALSSNLGSIESLGQQVISVDWSQKGCNTGIYRQGDLCRAGYAIASANAVTYAWVANKRMAASQTSAEELLDCTYNFGNKGCDGGTTPASFQYVYKFGLSFESQYPYSGHESGSCKFQSPSQFRISNYYQVAPNNSQKLVSAVTQQPMTAAVDALGWRFYQTGIYDGSNCSTTMYNHFVTIVGFGNYQGVNYWKIEESNGQNWGQNGYLFVARSLGTGSFPCGLPANVYYPYFAQ